jgi:glycosyltransferase involved in cell wall biosynthesis
MAAESSGGRALRIMFLTHYFPPEIGAPQARMFELAKRLGDAGEDVTVVTAFPNYPTGVVHDGYRGRFAMEERLDGVRVLRRWVFATPNAGFFKRIFNWFSFVVTSLTAARKVGKVDVIFVQSPPLPIGIAALAYARLKRAPFVFNVSDIWPQSAVELGMLRNRLAIWMAERLEMHIYRRAARVTVPTPGILERLADRGVPRKKLVLLTNGVDTSIYQPQPPDAAMAQRLGLDGRKVFLYAGTHGLSQGLDVILEAAKLTPRGEVLYVLAGEGADKAALVEKARTERIENVKFLPNQPKSSMPALLNLAYAGIISLKPLDLFRHALPSKMFESMAVGQPLIAALWGEGADLVRAADCGLVTEPGNAAQLSQAVTALAADPEAAKRLGRNGRAYVDEHFNRGKIALRLRDLLREVAGVSR